MSLYTVQHVECAVLMRFSGLLAQEVSVPLKSKR